MNTPVASPGLIRRARMVARVKAILAALFLAVVVVTLPSPISIGVGLIDLACVPLFVWLARRAPQAATYALIVETALALTPRQFVQGYVNGVNWPIYIVLPLVAAYMLRRPRAVVWGAILTAAIAVPVMLVAALTLPAAARPNDIVTLLVFVAGLMLGAAVVVADMLASSNDRA